CRVDLVLRMERPDAHADLRLGTVGRSCEEGAVARDDWYRVAARGIAFDAFDRAGEHPGMTMAQRFFASGLQDEAGSFLIHNGVRLLFGIRGSSAIRKVT